MIVENFLRKDVETVPRRKKSPAAPAEPDYVNLGKNPEKHVISKSDPLLSLSKTSMTLPELKILDAYLDRINTHDPDKRTVQLEKGKIEEFLGVSRILRPDLEKRLRNLAQVVKIEDDTKPNGFTLISLFEAMRAWQDEDGLWQITLTCTPSAREYIFNPENLSYLRYALSDVIGLSSRYSYCLYLYLLKNRFRGSWEVSVDDLKEYLGCTAPTYSQFFRFNGLVLKKCHDEIEKKTSLRYTYTPVKRGRSIKAIRFSVQAAAASDVLPGQLTLESYEPVSKTDEENEGLEFLRSACSRDDEPEFSPAEMQQIFEVLVTVPDYKLPDKDAMPVKSTEMQRYHYLREKYAAMNRMDEKKPIAHRFAYFLAMLKKDAKSKGEETNEV